MSEDNKNEPRKTPENDDAASDSTSDQQEQESTQDGPTFTKGSDPLAGVKKGASDAMEGMEGKTVSMKLYVGTIVGVIVLMLLARCGG